MNITTGKNLSCWMLHGLLLALVGLSTPAGSYAAKQSEVEQVRLLRGITVDSAGVAMDEATVASGLKEALHVAVDNAVALRGARGGFAACAGFRIAPARELCSMVGNSSPERAHEELQRLEEGMNRVAEMASTAAGPLLHEAVARLRIPYAIEVLRGDSDAATAYLHRHKFANIEEEFSSLVRRKMGEAGLYNNLSDLLRSLEPTSEPEDAMYDDLHTYITAEALDGIFATLKQEEHAIRTRPAARTTEQIKRVFSR